MLKNFLKGLVKAYDDVMDTSVGEELKKAGREIREQISEATGLGKATESAASDESVSEPARTVTQATVAPVVVEAADAEGALTVPAEDGDRGEFSCWDEKNYSYLIPKNPGFSDIGNSGAAEIHQAYAYGKMVNYEYDATICFSIAPEFNCQMDESRAKAAFTRYDGAPSRSKFMTVNHPIFTHVYVFESARKYRMTYLKKISDSELLGCELAIKKSGGDDAWKAKMIDEFKRFAGSCREV